LACCLAEELVLSTIVDSRSANDSVQFTGMQAAEARTLKTFGRSVRSLRKQRRLSQEALAEASQLSRNYISDIERGVRNPSLLALIALARSLRISLLDLLADVK
jgi:DNA-binding XRE family transcriptional regulator